MRPQSIIHGIAWSLGETRDVASLVPVLGAEVVESLLMEGLDQYRESGASTATLAFESVQKTIAIAGIDEGDVGAVIYCTNGTMNDQPHFAELAAQGGLRRVPIFGLGMNGCANATAAIGFAVALLRREGLRHILVVTTDRAEDTAARLTQFQSAVLSDGAASFLVSEEAERGWSVIECDQLVDHRIRDIRQMRHIALRVALTGRCIRKLVSQTLDRVAMSADELGVIVTTNLKRSAVAALLGEAGAPTGKVFDASLGAVSHVFSADPLINLASYANATPGAASPVLMLAMSFHSWGACVLRPTED